MSEPVLSVDGLTAHIDLASGTVRAVDGVSFDLCAGETFALLGESGCGKSMTALALLRLLPEGGQIVSGHVRLDGRDLLRVTEREMRGVRGGDIGMIFQEPATSLNPVLTVGRQIGEVLDRHHGLRGSVARDRMLELLGAVGIPDPERRLGEFPFQLSGGLKQRVMIAMALAGEPRLIIADEPTTALDVTIQAQVLELLVDVQKRRGTAMLLITHDLGVVARVAHRIGVMYAGHLVEISDRMPFFESPKHPYSRRLFASLPSTERRGAPLETIPGSVPSLDTAFGGCRFVERCDSAHARCAAEPPAWHEAADGQRVRCHLYAPGSHAGATGQSPGRGFSSALPAARGEALLQVDELKVHFPIRRGVFKRTVGHVRAVDGVSIDLAPGRTLALVGESGCGKTTVGKAILQLVRPSAGSVRFDGQRLETMDERRLRPLRSGLQMIFQDPYASLNPRMRVGAIVAEGMQSLGRQSPGNDSSDVVSRLLESVGLSSEMASRFPHEFSGGQRQRIAIARALAVNPRLLVCDEPTSALDVSVQAQILNLLKSLQRELGIAYLFITHNIAVVDYLADDIAVMYLGQIVESGTVDDILRSPKHPYTEALLAAVPVPDPSHGRPVILLKGDLPSPVNPPSGCRFHPRCPKAFDPCRSEPPEETPVGDAHVVRCHLYR